MDKFKSFLKEQADANPPKLPDGHRDRFLEKLTGSTKKKNIRDRAIWTIVAASAAIVAVVMLLPGEPGATQDQKKSVLGDTSFEMAELEHFFIIKIKELSAEGLPDDPILHAHLEKIQKLESEYENLQLALAKNYGNERIIDAMIQNYKMRIAVLERMRQTKLLLQTNKENHENKS